VEQPRRHAQHVHRQRARHGLANPAPRPLASSPTISVPLFPPVGSKPGGEARRFALPRGASPPGVPLTGGEGTPGPRVPGRAEVHSRRARTLYIPPSPRCYG